MTEGEPSAEELWGEMQFLVRAKEEGERPGTFFLFEADKNLALRQLTERIEELRKKLAAAATLGR